MAIGYCALTINLLLRKGLETFRVGVAKFIAKFNETGSLSRKSGSGRSSKITTEIKEIVERKMSVDNETIAYQLQSASYSRIYHRQTNGASLPQIIRMDLSQ